MVKKKKKGKGKGYLAGLVAALLVLSPLMSHAAATAVVDHRFVAGDRRVAVGSWNPGVYATGGVAVTARSIGLTEIHQVIVEGAGGIFYQYDKANGKILAYRSAGFTPAGTNSSDSAGTPAGTNAASAVTGTATGQVWTAGAYTPAGTNGTSSVSIVVPNDVVATPCGLSAGNVFVCPGGTTITGGTAAAQVFTGTPAALTGTNADSAVTGTAAAQVFTGSALAGHTHTFSGTPVAAAAAAEVANAVNLSASTFTGRFIAIGR